jgi:hypothetical protein
MANEIAINRASGLALYAIIWRAADVYVYNTTTAAFEAPGTWNDARVADCDIGLTEVAGTGWYRGNIPSGLPAGLYFIRVYEQAGASPSSADVSSGGMDAAWSGTRLITILDEVARNVQYLS